MEWIKVFHIVMMVSWFAGLFYLPRLFVNHAACTNNDIAEQLDYDAWVRMTLLLHPSD